MRRGVWSRTPTIAAPAFALALLGRLMVGPTFGTLMWVGFALPFTVMLGLTTVPRNLLQRWPDRALLYLVVSVTGCLPLIGVIGLGTWVKIVLLIMLWTGALVASDRLAAGGLGEDAGRCVVVITWLTWWIAPLFLGGPGVAWVEHSPILLLMSLTPSLGDWSHESLAYQYLTRFGQDIAFLPASDLAGIGWSAILWGAIETLGIIMVAMRHNRGVFHVEH